jgi:two-component system cell cycle response regulator
MDRRAVLGVGSGLAGIVVGLAAAIVGVAALAVVAGVLAAVAGATTWWISADLGAHRRADQRLADEVLAVATTEAPTDIVDRALAGEDGTDEERLVDTETGLFSEGYFRVALDTRVSAARRHLRPVSVVMLDVVEGVANGSPRPTAARLVGEGIRSTVRDADTACRLADGRYALVLEDTPENGAIWTVERIRRRLVHDHDGLTLWAGVACYPAHAFTSESVLDQAEKALEAAREWRQDRIEVALAP